MVVMPLVGTVDTRRAERVLETLLAGISERGATVAILDITGVGIVDTQVANALVHAAQAVKLLGAQVILTGIRPEVAQTLVGMGADLRSITTHGTLQSGIAATLRRQHSRKPIADSLVLQKMQRKGAAPAHTIALYHPPAMGFYDRLDDRQA